MEINHHWNKIRKLFRIAFRSSLHYSIATVNENGSPHVTPIGSLFLRRNNTGFFFDDFLGNTSRNFKNNQRVCVLALNSGKFFWIKSLFLGKFKTTVAVRLNGTVGEQRKATEQESALFRKRVQFARKFKGYNILWKDFKYVRDIHFDSFEPVNTGTMTHNLWAG